MMRKASDIEWDRRHPEYCCTAEISLTWWRVITQIWRKIW